MRFALPCVLAALVAPQALAQRIAIVPFTGPGANGVRNQVVSALCDQAECVGEKKVVGAGGKPDWKKAKKEKVKFIVAGKVNGKGKKKSIELQVEHKAGAAKFKKSWPLEGGELSDKNLAAAGDALAKAMGLEKKPPPEAPPEEKKPPPEAPPEEKKPPPEEKKKKVEAPPPEVVEPPPPAPLAHSKRPVFSVELGLDVQSRVYSYSSIASTNLRSYNAPFIPGLDLKAELYPLAIVQQGFLAGLGLEVGYAFSIGLKSRRKGPDGMFLPTTFPTSISKLDLALKFQIRPISGSDAYFAPFFGYRSHSFGVGLASDGSSLDGPPDAMGNLPKATLPPISYSALKVGVGGELPFGSTGLLLYARFAVLPVLSAKDILGAAFFKAGSAFGVDGALGLGFKLPFSFAFIDAGALQLRLGFDFARYGLSFKTAATDEYVAEGAVDQYLGGTLAVRFTY